MIAHIRTIGELRAAIADLPDDVAIDYSAWPLQRGTAGDWADYNDAGMTVEVVDKPRRRSFMFGAPPSEFQVNRFDRALAHLANKAAP
jgi:hypothetical protein